MPADDRQLALAFVQELEKALSAIRAGDSDGIAYAEMQPTALFLLEKSEAFRALLRKQFHGLSSNTTLQAAIDQLADSDTELAGIISGFMNAVFDVVHARKNNR